HDRRRSGADRPEHGHPEHAEGRHRVDVDRAGATARSTRNRGGEHGQSIVEFVLVLTPLLIVLFGIVEFGMIMYQKTTVIHDAREAVRLAAVDDLGGKTLPSDAPSGAVLAFTCTTNPSSGNPSGQFNV